ncbi:siroheme synthase [Thalassotalea sp. M1531]|uniref:precorrin-2 dehydrogenase n=1 Tax=Thalassotalea algicola TaxID=2716224 RepID=A0A7Y0LFR8_9GAMM|nr:bifunctional precorrin-2 dehydrogenase/sirohydrochlorin ferrochelatase [Thalassotalea algicola]NMP33518.1 siroheme synthase [Thalassotalea algicola]
MKYFPIFLDARHIKALVIGGGEVAARKIELLLKSTKDITIMTEQLGPSVHRLIKENDLTWLTHPYQPGHMSGMTLVIAATDNAQVNQAVQQEASQHNLLVNVVDQPELCSYITPAIIDRDPMLVAISSSGSAPVLVRMLREQIERSMPKAYGKLAEFSFKFRDHVKARIKGVSNRRSFWEGTLRGNIGNNILNGKVTEAEQQLIASLKTEVPPAEGNITFIHTMTGNPDGLTLAAHRALQFADAVFYDHQVNEEFLEYVRRDAEKYPQQIESNISVNYQHAIELAESGHKVIYFLDGYEPLPPNQALTQSAVNKITYVCGS